MKHHLPNALTLTRILLAPVFLVLLFLGTFWGVLSALVVFIAAAVSDWLDGKMARHYSVASRLGMFLDPLADKVLVLGAFVALAVMLPDVVPWWAVVLIAVRDVLITGLRMIAESRDRPLRTIPMAKTKTGLQLGFVITALVLMTLERLPGFEPVAALASRVLHGPLMAAFLYLVVALTVYTGAHYLIRREPAPRPNS